MNYDWKNILLVNIGFFNYNTGDNLLKFINFSRIEFIWGNLKILINVF